MKNHQWLLWSFEVASRGRISGWTPQGFLLIGQDKTSYLLSPFALFIICQQWLHIRTTQGALKKKYQLTGNIQTMESESQRVKCRYIYLCVCVCVCTRVCVLFTVYSSLFPSFKFPGELDALKYRKG